MKVHYSIVSPRKALEMTGYKTGANKQAILLSHTPAIPKGRSSSVIKLETVHNSTALVRTTTEVQDDVELVKSEIIDVAYQYDDLSVIALAIHDDYSKLTHDKMDTDTMTYVYVSGYCGRKLAEYILRHTHGEFRAFAKDPISDKLNSDEGYHGRNNIDWNDASIEVGMFSTQQEAGKDDHKGAKKCDAMSVRHLSNYQAVNV